MRISDWSSDVCYSDLGAAPGLVRRAPRRPLAGRAAAAANDPVARRARVHRARAPARLRRPGLQPLLVEARRLRHRLGAAGRRRRAQLHRPARRQVRSEEHTSELQSLMRISYAVFCLKKKNNNNQTKNTTTNN